MWARYIRRGRNGGQSEHQANHTYQACRAGEADLLTHQKRYSKGSPEEGRINVTSERGGALEIQNGRDEA